MAKKNLHSVFTFTRVFPFGSGFPLLSLLRILLLLIFVNGQVLLFTHQHEVVRCCHQLEDHSHKKGYHEKKAEEKCVLCEAILHQALLLPDQCGLQAFGSTVAPSPCLCWANYGVFHAQYSPRGPPELNIPINQRV